MYVYEGKYQNNPDISNILGMWADQLSPLRRSESYTLVLNYRYNHKGPYADRLPDAMTPARMKHSQLVTRNIGKHWEIKHTITWWMEDKTKTQRKDDVIIKLHDEDFALNFMLHLPSETRSLLSRIR